jgi:hypothetical protein
MVLTVLAVCSLICSWRIWLGEASLALAAFIVGKAPPGGPFPTIKAALQQQLRLQLDNLTLLVPCAKQEEKALAPYTLNSKPWCSGLARGDDERASPHFVFVRFWLRLKKEKNILKKKLMSLVVIS